METRDWFSTIRDNAENKEAEFDLNELKPGDLLRIVTKHTRYDFKWVDGRDADLESDREDRPRGRVRVMGCTFGSSATIKPDRLFCGGHLEFTYENGALIFLTSGIREIRCVRKGAG